MLWWSDVEVWSTLCGPEVVSASVELVVKVYKLLATGAGHYSALAVVWSVEFVVQVKEEGEHASGHDSQICRS